jgi:hypothetical protein
VAATESTINAITAAIQGFAFVLSRSIRFLLDEDGVTDERFMDAACDVLAGAGPLAAPAIPALVRHGCTHAPVAAAAARCLLSVGAAGASALLDALGDLPPGADTAVLYALLLCFSVRLVMFCLFCGRVC